MFRGSLTSTVIILFFSYCNSNAATIIVNATDGTLDDTDGVCSISEAIINANDDASTYSNCLAGNGTDNIELTTNISLTQVYENVVTFGRNGTPAIDSDLTLNGQGFTLQRDNNLTCDLNDTEQTGEFRLLRTTTNANVLLQNINLLSGCVDSNGAMTETYSSQGGAVFNGGTLNIDKEAFKHNKANIGGALFNNGTIDFITNGL